MPTQPSPESPFGHLTPFVVAIATERVRAGATLSPELMLDCLREAREKDDERCMRWAQFSGYESTLTREIRTWAVSELSRSVYDGIRAANPDAVPQMNPRWIECAKELGREPTSLEYILWSSRRHLPKRGPQKG